MLTPQSHADMLNKRQVDKGKASRFVFSSFMQPYSLQSEDAKAMETVHSSGCIQGGCDCREGQALRGGPCKVCLFQLLEFLGGLSSTQENKDRTSQCHMR